MEALGIRAMEQTRAALIDQLRTSFNVSSLAFTLGYRVTIRKATPCATNTRGLLKKVRRARPP